MYRWPSSVHGESYKYFEYAVHENINNDYHVDILTNHESSSFARMYTIFNYIEFMEMRCYETRHNAYVLSVIPLVG